MSLLETAVGEGFEIQEAALKELVALASQEISKKMRSGTYYKTIVEKQQQQQQQHANNSSSDITTSSSLLARTSTHTKRISNKPRKKTTERKINSLSKLIPGYVAPMNLETGLPIVTTSELRKRSEIMQDSTTTQALKMTQNRISNPIMASSFKMGVKGNSGSTSAASWFHMKATEKTDEVKTDIAVIRMRNILDPKRFYKNNDKSFGTGPIQVGTVVEGTGEYYSSRLTKKQRRTNLTEELMADSTIASYTKNKFREIQHTKEEKFDRKRQPGRKQIKHNKK